MLDADALLDRRRLKRQLTLWRVVTVLALVAVAIVAIERFSGVLERDHVARFTIDGFIYNEPAVFEALAEIAEDSRARAVIIHIDSPGGTFVGGERLFDAIRKIAEHKPVVAVMGTVATSAAYMAAIASDRIYAHRGTVTGSIGVIMQTTDITGFLEMIGVSAEAIKSGPLKAVPSPFEPLTDDARAVSQAIIDDMHELFTDMVAERRGFDADEARRIADGRVYSGRQAFELRLVDALGDEDDALDWLSESEGVSRDLPIFNVEPERLDDDWLGGLDSLTGNMLFSERLRLDGLISVWHPE